MKLHYSLFASSLVSLASSQQILFTLESPDPFSGFYGVIEIDGHVYASSNEIKANDECGCTEFASLWKLKLDGSVVLKKRVGEDRNKLGQISAFGGTGSIVVNPSTVDGDFSKGLQYFTTNDFQYLWNVDVETISDAACAPLVTKNDEVIVGFEGIGGRFSAVHDQQPIWTGTEGRPCGILGSDDTVLYTVSDEAGVTARLIRTGQIIQESGALEAASSGGSGGVVMTDDGSTLYASFIRGVVRFNVANLTDSQLLVTSSPSNAKLNPILSPLENILYSEDISQVFAYDLNATHATERFIIGGLDIAPAGIALVEDGETLLIPDKDDGALKAYDASTGEEKWEVSLGAGFWTWAMHVNAKGNRVYLAGKGDDDVGKVISIEIGSGTVSPAPTRSPTLKPSPAPSVPGATPQPTAVPDPSSANSCGMLVGSVVALAMHFFLF